MLFIGGFLSEEMKIYCIGQIVFLSKDGTLEKSLLFILISQQEDGNANSPLSYASLIFEGYLPGISSNLGLLFLFIYYMRALVSMVPLEMARRLHYCSLICYSC